MENTIENKKRFFAQYERQEIAKSSKSAIPHIVSAYFVMGHHYLELKPLSSITDEDKMEIASIFWQGKDNKLKNIDEGSLIVSHFSSGHGLFNPVQTQHGFDYLRIKGYAVPWMGLSIERLQEYGWIKLTAD